MFISLPNITISPPPYPNLSTVPSNVNNKIQIIPLMSKFPTPTNSPLISFHDLKQSLNRQLKQQNHGSLFDKIQIYDRVVGEYKIKRTNEQVLILFEQLIKQHGNTIIRNCNKSQYKNDNPIDNINDFKTKNYPITLYNSPPNPRKQPYQIQDPQLFSFSKPRNLSSKFSQPSQPSLKPNPKINSDQPHCHLQLNQTTQRKVSQFTQQYPLQPINTIQPNLHQLTSHLTNHLKHKYFIQFHTLLKTNLTLNKKSYLHKITSTIYQLNLLKKSFTSIHLHNKQTKTIIQQFIHNKNQQKLLTAFSSWATHAHRTEQDKIKEKLIKAKKLLTIKTIAIMRFLSNTAKTQLQQLQHTTDKQQLHRKSQQLKQQIPALIKLQTITCIHTCYTYKNIIKDKIQQLTNKLKYTSFKILIKLLTCIKQVSIMQQNKLIDKTLYKISSMQFIHKLKQQYHFQKIYWTTSTNQQPTDQTDIHPKSTIVPNDFNTNYLTYKYQKIVFIFQILDCVQHNLNRKGYKFLQTTITDSLHHSLHHHPAYNHYYLPYKLHKYFHALKFCLLTSTKNKINTIKYQIIGKKMLTQGLLGWYRNHLQKQLIKEHIQQQCDILSQRIGNISIKQFYREFSAHIRISTNTTHLASHFSRKIIISTLMLLKSYNIAKKYYRKLILHQKLLHSLKTQQTCFFAWKHHYTQTTRNRLLKEELQNLRKKYAVQKLQNNILQFSVEDRLLRKKYLNLCNTRKNDHWDIFMTTLKRNWQIAQTSSRLSNFQYTQKQNQLNKQIIQTAQKKFIMQLTQNWYHCKLQLQIFAQTTEQYLKRLLYKCFISMKCMLKVQKEERAKLRQISEKKTKNIKTRVFSQMIQKLIEKLILKRMIVLSKKYWFNRFMDGVDMERQYQEKEIDKQEQLQ